MSKKRLVAMFISLCIIVTLCVLGGAVFVVRDVEVVRLEGLENNTQITDKDIIATTRISYGKSIFAISESKVVSNIENTYPNIKVRGIERVFPNKIVINLIERVPMVAIKFKGQNDYLILDNNMCAIKKISVNEADIEEKLNKICVVKGYELEGTKNIYLGKQLPRIYGDEVVLVENIIAGLIKQGMELKQINEFMYSINFDSGVKKIYIQTNYGAPGNGVVIQIDYSGIDKDETMVYKKIMLAREKYVTLETEEKAKGFLIYDVSTKSYVHKIHI